MFREDVDGRQYISHYRLMEKLGEGGFGYVYLAEQKQPVRRRVAIKLLKPGMRTREAIARFEAESQALAMMDHPHIARVFDAGTTESGQPYFVMELVRGVNVMAFCSQHQLSLQKRLDLFVNVCEAVQHAHQKGIIHRDLKPSNVLVTLHDATPVVKVIDFGVAKALHEPLTEKTIYTRFAQMIGTPMYMSPEQAEMNSLDIDTRSDIYSLGVLLYELLTETTPFDQQRLQTASFDEMRRMIREEEPPPPSSRLTTVARTSTSAVAARRTTPQTVSSDLRGDLDWVVMKALEKDRTRRYETAGDLARDVHRYLEQQPVVARPPSQWYRFTRFARRNRAAFIATSLVVLTLVSGTIVSALMAIRATESRNEANHLKEDAIAFANGLKEANVLLDSARANADQQRWSLALTQYSKATELQPLHYLTWSGRGSLYSRLGAFRAAADDYAKAIELGAPANNPAWWGVPQLCVYAENEAAYRTLCVALSRQLDETEDEGQIMMAIRGLCLGSLSKAESRRLSDRMEQMLKNVRGHRDDFTLPSGPPGSSPSGMNPPPGLPFGPGGPDSLPGFPDFRGMPMPLKLYAAGLAHFRAGDMEVAIKLLRKAAEDQRGFPAGAMAFPVLAMALQADGQADAAQKALADSQRTLDAWLESFDPISGSQFTVPWFDILECSILHREAGQRVNLKRFPIDERLLRLELRALEMLSQN
jgi:serine/threonine protein kinase